jgi:hypothetical protein
VSRLQTQRRTIGDVEYEVAPLGLETSLDVLFRVKSIFAPTLREVSAELSTSKDDEAGFELAMRTALAGGAKLLETLTVDDERYLRSKFQDLTTLHLADGKAPRLANVPLHFEGSRLFDLFKWLAFCIEVNFASFFDAAKTEIQALFVAGFASLQSATRKVPDSSESPQTATGGSGD